MHCWGVEGGQGWGVKELKKQGVEGKVEGLMRSSGGKLGVKELKKQGVEGEVKGKLRVSGGKLRVH